MYRLERTRFLDRLEASLNYVAICNLTSARGGVKGACLLSNRNWDVTHNRNVHSNGDAINRRRAAINAAMRAFAGRLNDAKEPRHGRDRHQAQVPILRPRDLLRDIRVFQVRGNQRHETIRYTFQDRNVQPRVTHVKGLLNGCGSFWARDFCF